MNTQELNIVKSRLQACIDSVRFQHSGCDVHAVGNIQHTAQMLIEQLDENCLSDELIRQITRNVEQNVFEFFKKKYASIKV